jgi:hypothetical protein
MSFIEMSSAFGSGLSARMLRLADADTNQDNAAQSGLLSRANSSVLEGSVGWIFLMKGEVPSSFPANFGARSEDVLVTFAGNAFSNGGHFSTTNQSTNPCNISTQYVTAGASGACSWFWFLVGPTITTDVGSLPSASKAPYQQIIGTVGQTGSGADLTIPSTTITAGEQYRLLNLRLQFPTSWTY